MASGVDAGTAVLGILPDWSSLGKNYEGEGAAAVAGMAKRAAADFAGIWAGAKVFNFGRQGLAELEQMAKVNAQTEATLRSTGEQAGVTASHVDDLSKSLLSLSGTDDEVIKGGENMLLQFTNIQNRLGSGNDVFDRATKDALDLATAMGTDMASGATTLGMALQDPEQGMQRLKRAHIELSAEQKTAIKQFMSLGDTVDAQKIILGQVEKQVGGSAKAFGETLPGQVKIAEEELKNAKAEMVAGFAPAMTLGAHAVTFLSTEFQKMPAGLRAADGGIALVAAGTLALARPIRDVIALSDRWKEGRQRATEAAAASTVAETQSALAANADATAQTEDAVATEANAVAHENMQKSGSKLSGVLGKAGVAGAAAFAVYNLYEYGQSLNNTTLSTEQLTAMTKASNDELGKVSGGLIALARGGGAFGGMLDDALKKLEGMGSEGVGTIQRMRDQIAATGGDTSKFDAALAEAKTAQDNLKTSTDAGSTALGTESSSMSSVITKSQELGRSFTQAQAARQTALDSTKALFDAEQSFTAAQHGVEQGLRSVADAERSVGDANRRVEDSYRTLGDAEQRAAEAAETLRKAMQPADAETMGKAQLSVSEAHFRVADAQSAVAAAEEAAAAARKDGKHDAAEVADLDRKVEEAKNAVTAAEYAETDANKALQDVQAKGTDQDQAVIAAKKQVEDAAKAETTANQGVSDALRGVSDAQQRVIDAKDAVNSAYVTEAGAAATLADKQAALGTGVTSVSAALANQLTALQNIDLQLAPGSPARQHLDDYITHLFTLAGVFDPALAAASLGGVVGAGGVPAPPPFVPPHFASGGWAEPNELFRGAEKGWELSIIPKDGLYKANPNGELIVDHAQAPDVLAGLLGSSEKGAGGRHIHLHGDIVVQNATPEMASTSVGHELQIMADQLELVG